MLSVLYTSRENTILLSFPCKYNEIFISKIIVFALEELKKSFFFVFPFLIGYGIAASAGISYWLLLLPSWIMLCFLPVLIGSTLSIGLIFIKRFLETHTIVYAIVIICAIVGLFALTIFFLDKVPTPVRLIATYGKFMGKVIQFFSIITKYSLYYAFFGKMLFGIQVYLYLPLAVLVFVAAGVLCFFVAMPFYFKAASSSSENSKTKRRKNTHNNRFHGLYFTFLNKEIKLLFRTPSLINSAIIMILFFPVITYVMNFIISAPKVFLCQAP